MKPVVVAALLAASLAAQPRISATITPNPCPVGTPIFVTLEATQSAQSLSGCGGNAIISGSPLGPLAWGCTLSLTSAPVLGPGNPQTFSLPTSSGGTPISPGHYWVRVPWRTIAPLVVQPVAFFPFRIDPVAGGGGPVLSSTGPATRGQFLVLAINAPANAGGFYQLAISLTTNVGVPAVGGVHIALDPDPFLFLSFPSPNPQLFPDFIGFLDPSGASSFFNPRFLIPNYQSIRGLPLAVQGAVTAPSGAAFLTNGLTFSIQ
ncbi:MAG: hypothetical protein HRU14_10730 [Planctomycetes bacterium]|nr:hypothetical protein [Planctomycetota bacterium]